MRACQHLEVLLCVKTVSTQLNQPTTHTVWALDTHASPIQTKFHWAHTQGVCHQNTPVFEGVLHIVPTSTWHTCMHCLVTQNQPRRVVTGEGDTTPPAELLQADITCCMHAVQ